MRAVTINFVETPISRFFMSLVYIFIFCLLRIFIHSFICSKLYTCLPAWFLPSLLACLLALILPSYLPSFLPALLSFLFSSTLPYLPLSSLPSYLVTLLIISLSNLVPVFTTGRYFSILHVIPWCARDLPFPIEFPLMHFRLCSFSYSKP